MESQMPLQFDVEMVNKLVLPEIRVEIPNRNINYKEIIHKLLGANYRDVMCH